MGRGAGDAAAEALTAGRSPLGRTVATTPTDIWNDSCAVDELEYAIAYGAAGATANPTIVHDVWKENPDRWRDRVPARGGASGRTEGDLAWAVVEAMSVRAAPLFVPAFEASGGRKGRLSVQTDPTLFRSFDGWSRRASTSTSLAPNIIVKFPATQSASRRWRRPPFAA